MKFLDVLLVMSELIMPKKHKIPLHIWQKSKNPTPNLFIEIYITGSESESEDSICLNHQKKNKATLFTRAEQSTMTKLGPRPITNAETYCGKNCKLTFYTSNLSLNYQAQVKGV